mmetsp:Transcript_26136/g.44549  ORF Transcript_26136/g.44549 Transcript_26136/m.44549 type:complete len:330 (-) Transcript_26136:123-1112(-)
MVNPNPNSDEFYARALASFNNQMALANTTAAIDIESYAKTLVEDDLPKIDSAVKSFLSLVAARSAVASDIDVISPSTVTGTPQCTFATSVKTPMDANRCALMCARTLLSTINSTNIPSDSIESTTENENKDETKSDYEEKMKIELQKRATQILWNRLVQQSSAGTGEEAKQTKPSKVLGRDSLRVLYPYIQERFRRGMVQNDIAADTKSAPQSNNSLQFQSLSNDLLPPVNPPKGIENDQWEAFYTEFGDLLFRACDAKSESKSSKGIEHDDSALIWSNDKGSAELRQRREMRAQRATEALSSVEGAKAVVADAVLGTVAEDDDSKPSS